MKSRPNKTILIVDDSTSLRLAVSTALSRAGYDVVAAGNGEEALNKLDGRRYHLVISDVNMAQPDGVGFIQGLSKSTQYRSTPVIMLTTQTGKAKKTHTHETGRRAWVVKPFQTATLLDAVADLVATKEPTNER